MKREEINFFLVLYYTYYANYTYYFTADCGCCSDSDTDTELLAHVLDDMSDTEFNELCDDVAKLI